MHDPEFEKQVQKKLEELRFDPSGAVWAKVEQEMKKDKRRRPLLWIFLLTGMLLGTGSWFLVGSYKNYKQTNTKTAETGTKVLPENNDEKKKSADNQIVESTNDNPIHQQKTPEQEEDPKGNTGRVHALMAGHKSITKNNTTIKPQTSSLQKKSLDDKQSVPLFQGKNDEIEEKIKRKKENPDPVSPIARNIAADSMKTSKTDLGDNENTTADTQVSKEHLADQINDKKEVLVTRNNKATDSQRNKTAFVKKIISRKSTSLKMGLTAGGGFSDVSKMMSGFQSPAGTAGNNASTGPSFIQKGISFYAGAFLEKLFSKTISLSAGLNYHYYSTKIRTGKTDDSIIYVPAYNFSTASNPVPASISRPSYYASGTTNSYINVYHFLELPVWMTFQLKKSDKLFLAWQAGLSFSYLINTNALQFDPSSQTYYKDNSLFNKTQVNLSTGLTIGFYHKKSLLEIGPEIQYGTTNMLHGYTKNSQHVFYGGLKFSIEPWKK